MATPSGSDPESRFSLRLRVDLSGRKRKGAAVIAVACRSGFVPAGPFLWRRLIGKWLMGVV
jgi:hypothetical protein